MTEGDFSFPLQYLKVGIIYMSVWGTNGQAYHGSKKWIFISLNSYRNLSLGSQIQFSVRVRLLR